MDWIALDAEPLWHDFFHSKEVQSRKTALYQQLVHGTLDQETRGIVRGQIKMLESLETIVEGLAKQQRAEREKKDAPAPVTRSRLESLLPRIF